MLPFSCSESIVRVGNRRKTHRKDWFQQFLEQLKLNQSDFETI